MLALAALASLGACARNSANGADAGGDALALLGVEASAPSSASASSASGAPSSSGAVAGDIDAGPSLAPGPSGEAARAEVPRLDADALATQLELVKKHFGAAAGPFVLQRTGATAGRHMVLVSSRDESDPMLLAFDGDKLLWSKERPTAGMIPPTVNLALTAHPAGGATLFAYDVPTKIVAARVWEADGAPFADFQVMKVDACDDLSAARWPTRGWVVTCAWLGGARAQLLREDGTMAWRRDGVDVGAAWRTPAPLSIGFDGPDGVFLVQYGDVRPGPPGDHVVATRYDAKGRPTWAAPLDLGPVTRVARTREHVPMATVPGGGGVRVEVTRGIVVDVDSSGHKTTGPKHGFQP